MRHLACELRLTVVSVVFAGPEANKVILFLSQQKRVAQEVHISNGWTSHLLFFAVVKIKEHQQSLVFPFCTHLLFLTAIMSSQLVGVGQLKPCTAIFAIEKSQRTTHQAMQGGTRRKGVNGQTIAFINVIAC